MTVLSVSVNFIITPFAPESTATEGDEKHKQSFKSNSAVL